MKRRRVFIVPRWGSSPDSDWYRWLAAQLAADPTPAFDAIIPLRMPSPTRPVFFQWVQKIRRELGTHPGMLRETVLVGHSVGALACLHSLQFLPQPMRVGGVLCVAGWLGATGSRPGLQPWLEAPLNLHRVRRAAGKIINLISDNDPFAPDWRAVRAQWQHKLGSAVIVVPNAGHFLHDTAPAVLEAIVAHFAR